MAYFLLDTVGHLFTHAFTILALRGASERDSISKLAPTHCWQLIARLRCPTDQQVSLSVSAILCRAWVKRDVRPIL
jgi:hypothetical protein